MLIIAPPYCVVSLYTHRVRPKRFWTTRYRIARSGELHRKIEDVQGRATLSGTWATPTPTFGSMPWPSSSW